MLPFTSPWTTTVPQVMSASMRAASPTTRTSLVTMDPMNRASMRTTPSKVSLPSKRAPRPSSRSPPGAGVGATGTSAAGFAAGAVSCRSGVGCVRGTLDLRSLADVSALFQSDMNPLLRRWTRERAGVRRGTCRLPYQPPVATIPNSARDQAHVRLRFGRRRTYTGAHVGMGVAHAEEAASRDRDRARRSRRVRRDPACLVSGLPVQDHRGPAPLGLPPGGGFPPVGEVVALGEARSGDEDVLCGAGRGGGLFLCLERQRQGRRWQDDDRLREARRAPP